MVSRLLEGFVVTELSPPAMHHFEAVHPAQACVSCASVAATPGVDTKAPQGLHSCLSYTHTQLGAAALGWAERPGCERGSTEAGGATLACADVCMLKVTLASGGSTAAT